MKKILDLISEEVVKAFEEAGYSADFAKVTLSNRPDLCEYQCNGALAAAKTYKKAPIMIANDVVAKLKENGIFQEVQAVSPGFINLKLSGDYLAEYLKQMQADENLSVEKAEHPKKTSWTTADQTGQNRCMSDICVLRSSVRASNVSDVLWVMR